MKLAPSDPEKRAGQPEAEREVGRKIRAGLDRTQLAGMLILLALLLLATAIRYWKVLFP